MLLSLFNEYGTTYEYICTYIHTDIACVQHVNVGLAQACPNYVAIVNSSRRYDRANIEVISHGRVI